VKTSEIVRGTDSWHAEVDDLEELAVYPKDPTTLLTPCKKPKEKTDVSKVPPTEAMNRSGPYSRTMAGICDCDCAGGTFIQLDHDDEQDWIKCRCVHCGQGDGCKMLIVPVLALFNDGLCEDCELHSGSERALPFPARSSMSTHSRSPTSPVSPSSSHVAAAPPASPPPGVAAARAAVAAATAATAAAASVAAAENVRLSTTAVCDRRSRLWEIDEAVRVATASATAAAEFAQLAQAACSSAAAAATVVQAAVVEAAETMHHAEIEAPKNPRPTQQRRQRHQHQH
jgi:hypothetical protein